MTIIVVVVLMKKNFMFHMNTYIRFKKLFYTKYKHFFDFGVIIRLLVPFMKRVMIAHIERDSWKDKCSNICKGDRKSSLNTFLPNMKHGKLIKRNMFHETWANFTNTVNDVDKTSKLINIENCLLFLFIYLFIYVLSTEGWKYPVYIKQSFPGKHPYYKVPDRKHSGHQRNLKALRSQ